MSCHDIISDKDIENIYDVKEVSSYDIDTDCFDESKKLAKIDIYLKRKKLNKTYITREYHESYELRGTKNLTLGKVALHQTFFLKNKYQKLDLATTLFWREMDTYRDNNFREIHLDATEDGIIVWRSLGYRYLDESTEANLMIRWYEYFSTIFSDISNKERANVIYKTKKFEQVLRKYKAPTDRESFPEWLRSQKLVTAEPMFYKLYD